MLLAEEVEADLDEIDAVERVDREDDGTRFTPDEVRARLGLSPYR